MDLMRLALIVVMLTLLGCANEPYMMPDTSDDANAPREALDADMFYRKPIPDHRTDKKWEFYYKHCSVEDDGKAFVSKRTFACTDAY